jgi:dihydrofolate synthase/folylpolyglutamate synthase
VSQTDRILQRLLALHPNKLIDLKLDRIERLLAALGHPEQKLPPVIHVAGTNGKGSTIAFMRAMLEASGKSVHVYTSPDLVSFRERIRLAGKLVSARRLNDALTRCEEANEGRPITYFEITTAAALLLFSEIRADVLLLEVGLGGRFDATNVIDKPLGAVITPVSIDHVEFLGPDLAGIAREKAGIMKKTCPCVIGEQLEEGLTSLRKEARALGITPFVQNEDFHAASDNGRMIYQDEDGLLDLPMPGLPGEFQIANAGLAIAALRHFGLGLTEAEIAKGIASTTWPARLTPIKTGKLHALIGKDQELWLDGGHNEAGGKVLAGALTTMNSTKARPLVLVMGTLKNKDAAGYLSHFASLNPEILAVPIPGEPAARKAAEIVRIGEEAGFSSTPMRGLKSALQRAAKIPNARIVICGSLYLAGHMLKANGTPPD